MATLREMYQNQELQSSAERWRDFWVSASTVDRELERTGEIADTPADMLGKRLDLLNMGQEQESAARLLRCLPVQDLLESFGERAAGWMLANEQNNRFLQEHYGQFEEQGYDGHFLQKSRVLSLENQDWLQMKTGDRFAIATGRELMMHNAIMEAVMGPGIEDLDIGDLVEKSAQKGIALSKQRRKQYGLIAFQADSMEYMRNGRVLQWNGQDEAKEKGLHFDMWLDTPVGIALTYKGLPQAIGGLAAGGASEVEIWQMQRVRGYVVGEQKGENERRTIESTRQPRGLMPLDWQKLFVYIAAEIADKVGADTLGIREADKIPGYNCYITTEQAELAYNVPAQRLGFERGSDGDWHMPVRQAQEL
jgi:hypothetical protein